MDFLTEKYLDNPLYLYFVCIGVVFGSIVVGLLLRGFGKARIKAYADRTETKLDDLIAGIFDAPLTIFFAILGFYIALSLLSIPPYTRSVVQKLLVFAMTLFVVGVVSKLIDQFFAFVVLPRVKKTESRIDDQVAILVRKTMKFLLWCFCLLMILGNLGYNVWSLITGLGLGGLAFALAAKDTLANIIGGVTMLADKPFAVGDMVDVKGVMGTVEEIGLRTTRVRTFAGHLVSIPNAVAANSVLENISARPMARVLFTLRVDCGTPFDKLQSIEGLVTEVVGNVEGTSQEKDPMVHLVEFGESSLNYQIIYYIEDTSRYLDIKHAVNTGILEGLSKSGISIPYNTYTVIQEKPKPRRVA